MSQYAEDDFLMLSGIQHFAFCRRQWALIHIEQQWAENLRTIEGEYLHERVHDQSIKEKRKELSVIRGMPIQSYLMGISGACDVVEFRESKTGVSLSGYQGIYEIIPIEYKRGKPKTDDIDIVQLTAQAMCLEEMLVTTITKGYLFYGEIRRRQEVLFTEESRNRVRSITEEMHQLYKAHHTPKVKVIAKCKSCSIKDLCLPALNKKKSVKDYIIKRIVE